VTTARELRVAEVFGPTLQGEGPSTGQPAAFVRLSGAHRWNLACRLHTLLWEDERGR
jgi:organic radical activating enzyme